MEFKRINTFRKIKVFTLMCFLAQIASCTSCKDEKTDKHPIPNEIYSAIYSDYVPPLTMELRACDGEVVSKRKLIDCIDSSGNSVDKERCQPLDLEVSRFSPAGESIISNDTDTLTLTCEEGQSSPVDLIKSCNYSFVEINDECSASEFIFVGDVDGLGFYKLNSDFQVSLIKELDVEILSSADSFVHNDQLFYSVNNTELWTSDGTIDGTVRLLPNAESENAIHHLIRYKDKVVVVFYNFDFWITDGTINGTSYLSELSLVFDKHIKKIIADDNRLLILSDNKLYEWTEGSSQVNEIEIGGSISNLDIVKFKNRIYLNVNEQEIYALGINSELSNKVFDADVAGMSRISAMYATDDFIHIVATENNLFNAIYASSDPFNKNFGLIYKSTKVWWPLSHRIAHGEMYLYEEGNFPSVSIMIYLKDQLVDAIEGSVLQNPVYIKDTLYFIAANPGSGSDLFFEFSKEQGLSAGVDILSLFGTSYVNFKGAYGSGLLVSVDGEISFLNLKDYSVTKITNGYIQSSGQVLR